MNKLVYLDWSTIQDAFKGTRIDAHQDEKDLHSFVYKVAQDKNLVFSLTHLFELLAGNKQDEILIEAKWIDSLNPRWLLPFNEIEEIEIKNYLKSCAGVNQKRNDAVFANSFIGMFSNWTVNTIANALKDPTVNKFCTEMLSSKEMLESFEGMKLFSVQTAQKFWNDRTNGLDKVSEAEMRTALAEKFYNAYIPIALKANNEINMQHIDEYAVKDDSSGLFLPPDESWVRRQIKSIDEMCSYLPFTFLNDRVMKNSSFDVVDENPTGRTFQRRRRSDMYDCWHLVGAAYCAIFTCDTRTSSHINGGREMIGMSKEIVRGADLGLFVKALENSYASL